MRERFQPDSQRATAAAAMHIPLVALVWLQGCAGGGIDTPSPTPTAATPSPVSSCPSIKMEVAGEWWDDAIVDPSQPMPQAGTVSGPGVGIGDLDGDGWLDVFMAVPLQASKVWRNDGAGELIPDASFTADGGPLPFAAGVSLVDLDLDGDLDAMLSRGQGVNDLLLVNDGAGHFESVVVGTSIGATRVASFADVDGDGDLDAFFARGEAYLDTDGIQAGTVVGSGNSLMINDGGLLTEDNGRLPAEVITDISYEGVWLDADADGDLDLFIVNDFGMWTAPHRLLLNDGAGVFELAEGCDCNVQAFGMGGTMADFNADGVADLYSSDIGGPDLLVGLGDGRFYDGTVALGADIPAAEDRLASWGVTQEDLNQDGWPDLLVMFGQLLLDQLPSDVETLEDYAGSQGETWVDGPLQRDALLMGDVGRGFIDVSVASGFNHDAVGRSVAVGDLDRDGLPDAVTAGIPYLRHYRNVSPCPGGVTLELEGPPNNPRGFGAQVDVVAGKTRYRRWMLRGASFSSSAPELYLGAAGATTLDVTVTWPDGSATQAPDLSPGQRYSIGYIGH